jgi:hypothetical protein
MDEAKLINKLRMIEALFSGATTEGEKIAAGRARDRILERLKLLEKEDPPVEYRFTMADMWNRKVFLALLRRYGIRPYRYSGQRYTTVMAKVSRRFVEETLWPEFQELSNTLQSYLSDVTDRVVQQVIHQDSSEAEVIKKPKQLPPGTTEPTLVTSQSDLSSTQKTNRQAGSSRQPDAGVKGQKNKNKRKRKKKRGRR